MKTPEQLRQLSDLAFQEESKSNLNFWLPRELEDEEVMYWKDIWIRGYRKAETELQAELKELREFKNLWTYGK